MFLWRNIENYHCYPFLSGALVFLFQNNPENLDFENCFSREKLPSYNQINRSHVAVQPVHAKIFGAFRKMDGTSQKSITKEYSQATQINWTEEYRAWVINYNPSA